VTHLHAAAPEQTCSVVRSLVVVLVAHHTRERQYGARARSSFFQTAKNSKFEFRKNSKKYQSVVYDLFYQCVKFYYEISFILSSEKITKI
jgi:hypothetical protein